MKKHQTSWENSATWYDKLVGDQGHYYHQKVILPKLIETLELKKFKTPSLLDLGCGNGILAKVLPKELYYVGIDASASLIKKVSQESPNRTFIHQDVTKPLHLNQEFTHAVFVLSLQNMEHFDLALKEASKALCDKGILILVLNHPCFRIPRQSHWGIDENQKIQYRRVDLYLSSLKIPINMDPSKNKTTTYSFHFPLQDLFHALQKSHLLVEDLEELISDKVSTGKNSKMENRAREQFPLFLMLKARKIRL